MSTLVVNSQAHLATMGATVAILFKMVLTLAIQGGKRFPAGTRPPEDATFKSLAKGTPQSYGMAPGIKDENKAKKAKEADIRWQRIVSNDLESIPLGMIIAWGSLLSAHSATIHSAFVITFVVSRILHTVFYANAVQPWRAIAWFTAVISMLVLAVNGLVGLL